MAGGDPLFLPGLCLRVPGMLQVASGGHQHQGAAASQEPGGRAWAGPWGHLALKAAPRPMAPGCPFELAEKCPMRAG